MNLPRVIPPTGLAGWRSLSNPASILCWTCCSAAFGIVDDLPLLSDLPLQLRYVFPDARLLLRFGTRQFALGIRQPVLEGLELPLR